MQKILFIFSKGFEKSGGATRGFQFAAGAAELGSHVEIFLIDDAIYRAQTGMADGVHTSTGEHMKDLIEKLVAKQSPIHVCKACADRRFISPDELINGARVSTSAELLKMMIDPEFKVITF